MENHQELILRLKAKLDAIEQRQTFFSKEVSELRFEINQLKTKVTIENLSNKVPDTEITEAENSSEKTALVIEQPLPKKSPTKSMAKKSIISKTINKKELSLEKFIGENLINKIGILIIIIGVGIGTKYSIENDLISPLTRIILGYLVGFGLLGVGIKLKTKYTNYSAVLVSGAIAIQYFTTYTAHDFYDLYSLEIAFVIMLIFTVFTVITSLHYNKQIIAHIGLVGAYTVPFLLSNNSGNTWILFTYMSIINIGILIIALKKLWKPLFFTSFSISWIIYSFWIFSEYSRKTDFYVAMVFLFVFFSIFYATFLVFKLRNQQKLKISDVILPLFNAFIFYAFGYTLISNQQHGDEFLGLFTLLNALVHFGVGVYIYKQKLVDKSLFYLIVILALTFITITIPVQLDGNWVTLLWISEATLLFWIGRTKKIAIYESIAYPLLVVSLISLYQDWITYYTYYKGDEENVIPIFNIGFLTSILFVVCFRYLHKINIQYSSSLKKEKSILKIASFSFPALFIVILYMAFRFEIVNYFNQLYNNSMLLIDDTKHYNNDIQEFETIWLQLYTLLFLSILSFVNIKKLKNQILGDFNLVLNFLSLILFLVLGLYAMSELRSSYLYDLIGNKQYYNIGVFHIGIRYVSYVFVAVMLYCNHLYLKQALVNFKLYKELNIFQHVVILWIASSEMIHILDLSGITESYKLGLSILWGIYALFLISLGIWKQKKHLRVGAISLFAITLVKLFFYDISHLNTISKIVVFLSLGILLLIISFLYNKFKHLISDEN